MKKVVILLVLASFMVISCDVPTQDEYIDTLFMDKVSGHKLYHHPDFDNLTSYFSITTWIYANVEYRREEVDVWSNPQTVVERGYGDCEDWAILFINIAYYAMGDKLSIALVDADERITRAVVDGGYINHAVVMDGDYIIEAQLGVVDHYAKVGFRYSFDEIFN